MEEKWYIKYKEDGSFWYATPEKDYLLMKFAGEIFDICHWCRLLWKIEKDEHEVAKQIYEEKYKDLLPISVLEYYNKEKCIQ